MEKDDYITEIMFRVDKSKDWKGTVYALIPHECSDFKGNVSSYQHVGQHSGANYQHCIQTSRPATEAEYADLKAEMENGHGYNIKVIKKRNYDKFLKSYYEVTGRK
ncbi:MAG: hypothetical protein IT215_01155 [Chitinophagaceae bacterium]|nr:hypothetical protein [Chitinophagaceae bacterium]